MNEPEGPGEHAFMRYLISQIRCPVCDHRYSPDDVLIMGHRDELWIMALVCPECETRGLVFALVEEPEELSEPLADLTPEEVARFEQRGPITADDVLDFHEFLRDYGGDMAGLIDW